MVAVMVTEGPPEREMLREIAVLLRSTARARGASIAPCGSVNVITHPRSAYPLWNGAALHPYAITLAARDLAHALDALARAGCPPRLFALEGLVPDVDAPAAAAGLAPAGAWPVMVYAPLAGPHLPGETPYGRLPDALPPPVTAALVETPRDLVEWLEVLRASCGEADPLRGEPDEIEPLADSAAAGHSLFVVAAYDDILRGAARAILRPPLAWLEIVAVAPLWHGMGLEAALIATATCAALDYGATTVFRPAPSAEEARLCRQLGFVQQGRLVTYEAISHASTVGADRRSAAHRAAPDRGARTV